MFKCILCLKPSRNSEPIPFTKRVNSRMTLEDCIRINLPCADAIFNEFEANQLTCTNCFVEFVNFYEFLGVIEENHSWNLDDVKIKTENITNDTAGSSNFNFVDITPKSDHPVIIQNCSVKLKRIIPSPSFVKVEEIKEEEAENILIEPINEPNDESDFEWPQNEDETTTWSLLNKLEMPKDQEKPKRKPKKKKVSDSDSDYTPSFSTSKEKPDYIRYLPHDKRTPEILATSQDFITIDGIEYKIPRKNYSNQDILPFLERPRRLHRFFDTEGENKIRNSVEVKCHECDDSPKFDSFYLVRKHFRKIHVGVRGYLKCCDKKFYRRYQLLEHLEFHEKSAVLRCKFCNNDKIFKSSSALRMHVKKFHDETFKPDCEFICQVCGKKLSSQGSLACHLELHSSKSYECYICQSQRTTFLGLKRHMKFAHEEAKYVTCKVCSKKVRDMSLTEHMSGRHSKSSKRRVKCKLCDRWLMTQSMATHIRNYHKGEEINCEICGKQLKNKAAINSHMKQCHTEDAKKHECSFCGKRFVKVLKLKEHVAVRHTREYPWACRVCGRKYRAEASWRIHEKQIHPEEYKKFFKPRYLKSNEELMAEREKAVENNVDLNTLEYQP